MFSKEILIKDFPMLKPEDSGLQALAFMDDLKLKHVPVVKDGRYICLISEKDIFNMNSQEESIENICLYAPYVREETSVLEILRLMSKDSLTLMPVVGENGRYMGAITLLRLVENLNEICNTGSDGALIAIEMNHNDYVLSQIIHLIESNNAHVLSMFSCFIKETGKQIILFKIDLEDASPVLRSLERFNYNVKYYLQKQLLTDETLKDRLDELMYYLEM